MRRSSISSTFLARMTGALALTAGLLAHGCTGGPAGGGNGDGGGNGRDGLPPETQRAAFQSQCAQNVITCTVSFPEAVVRVEATGNQQATETAAGFRVRGYDGDGVEIVQLIGSDSNRGQGASEIFYSWSVGASDGDPCTLVPGEPFSTEANPQVLLQARLHYVRLTVTNDLPPLDTIDSPECGTFENFRKQDFQEVEIEVVD